MTEPLEDLMVKSRRGTLSAEERRRLTLGLNASLEANLLYQAGCGFEHLPVVEAGDEAFLDGVASAAVQRFGQPKPAARHRPMRAAVAIYFASAVAAAGSVGGLYHVTRSNTSHRAAATTASAAPMPDPVVHPTVPRVQGMRTGEPLPVARSSDANARDSAAPLARCASCAATPSASCVTTTSAESQPRTVPQDAVAPKPETAQALFVLGNSARSDGRIADAMRAYQRIQQQFPSSREAGLATMSLGVLELQRGNPEAGLAHFRQALRTHPSPEALWGEAQSLHQLGRRTQERQALEELLRQYPSSAYAPAATKRLETQD